MNKIASSYQQPPRRTWGQSGPSNSPSPGPGLQRQQQARQQQTRMPVSSAGAAAPAAAAPRTVVVGDMVVADDSDTEGDVIEEDVDDDSDEDKPKVLRVITRRPARAAGAGATARAEPEPAWHALLRRTPSTRTASIARTRTPPRAQHQHPRPAAPGACQQAPPSLQGSSRTRPVPPRPAQLYGTPSRIIRTDASPKPSVNVPAKVLVPRNRLLFPLVTRNGRMLPVTSTRMPLGVAYRRQDGADGPQVVRRVLVSAVGPLSPAESAVLDGVLDLLEEHRVRYGGIRAYMEKYGVTATDTFPDGFP